jgi:ATP-dependent Clp protease ATP-binding subunit ClpC
MGKLLRKFLNGLLDILDYTGQLFKSFIIDIGFDMPDKLKKKKRHDKMERFAPVARRVLNLTTEATIQLSHNIIEPEHLLVGMVRETRCVAYRVLSELQINEAVLLEQIKRLMPPKHAPWGNPDLSDWTKQSLNLSVKAALSRGDDYIGTEHILIGIMCLKKPQINTILAYFSINAKTVIQHTEAILQQQRDDDLKDKR